MLSPHILQQSADINIADIHLLIKTEEEVISLHTIIVSIYSFHRIPGIAHSFFCHLTCRILYVEHVIFTRLLCTIGIENHEMNILLFLELGRMGTITLLIFV